MEIHGHLCILATLPPARGPSIHWIGAWMGPKGRMHACWKEKNILPPTGTQTLIPQLLSQWPSHATELPQFLHLNQTYSLSTNPPPENSLLCCAMSCATKTPDKVTCCCILFCDINTLFCFHVQPQFISVSCSCNRK